MDHAGHRHQQYSSSDRLIGLFTSPPIGPGMLASDELNEAEVCFSDKFTQHSIASLPSSESSAGTTANASHSRRRLFSRQSGLLATLSASASSKKIPPSRPIPGERDRSKSAGSKRLQQQSAPVRVPILAFAMADQRKLSALVDEDSDLEDDEILPPHEIVARRLGRSITCSMLEGAGRTLKGRDLHQVRNAIWQKTGFLD